MKIKLTAFALFFFGVVTLIACSYLSNDTDKNSWKQFRGNNRNGTFSETSINEKWIDKKPDLLWKQEVGSSFSEVLVSKDGIFTMSSDSLSGSEFIARYDAKTGDNIWKTIVDSIYIDPDGWGNGPRSTPALDNKAVYCLSSFGKLRALSIKNGEILWTVNIAKKFKSIVSKWAYTTSPLIIEDVIILEVGGNESKAFAAFDKETGKNIWIKGNGKPSYCSPTLATIDGIKQVIFANDSILLSFDKMGNQLWTYNMLKKSPTATPLFIAPNKIFISVMQGNFMVEVSNNTVTKSYSSNSIRNIFSTSCHYNGYIYGFSNNALQCISSIDGKLQWSEKGFGFGSLINISNKLLVLSDKGALKIVDAVPEAYTEIESFQALDGKSWTAPSFANGNVYLRNLTEMASYRLYN